MTATHHRLEDLVKQASNLRYVLFCLILGLVVATMPVQVRFSPQGDLIVSASYAWAESGSGKDDDDDDNGGQVSDGGDNDQPTTNTALRSGDNLYLRYANGWEEWVRNRRYVLKDPLGRTVADRAATFDDLVRMRAAAGL
jgi:hypothetical protein